jgi:hypothetical protein
MPNEHLLSAICRGKQRGIVNNWRDLLPGHKSDCGIFCAGHVLHPIYASTCSQYQGTTPQQILRNHSLWNYHRSFLPHSQTTPPGIETWHNIYNHKDVLHPKKLIRYRHSKQWRWCLECAQEDYANHGVCYWHIEHQLPGVSHCFHHPKSQLNGACKSCGYQVTNIKDKAVRLFPEDRCPICHSTYINRTAVPEHPVINWITNVTKQLNAEVTLDTTRLRNDLFQTLKIEPGVRTAAGIRRTSIARKNIIRALPLDVINWFFQTEKRRDFETRDNITPLCLRLLYDTENFIHPLSWLIISWIVLSKTKNLESYLIK